jgi:hypothetical protein
VIIIVTSHIKRGTLRQIALQDIDEIRLEKNKENNKKL